MRKISELSRVVSLEVRKYFNHTSHRILISSSWTSLILPSDTTQKRWRRTFIHFSFLSWSQFKCLCKNFHDFSSISKFLTLYGLKIPKKKKSDEQCKKKFQTRKIFLHYMTKISLSHFQLKAMTTRQQGGVFCILSGGTFHFPFGYWYVSLSAWNNCKTHSVNEFLTYLSILWWCKEVLCGAKKL